MTTQSRPIAVIISDIHFTPSTLELASRSLMLAQYKAKELDVPLVIAGDTMDSKAVLRAECVNRFMQQLAQHDAPQTYLLVGNHDLCNEKGTEHSLNFAFDLCEIVSRPVEVYLKNKRVLLIPYQSDLENLEALLKDKDNPDTIIMHQGVSGSKSGHYIQDKSAIPQEWVKDYRVISGHYHTRQDIKCGRPRKGAIGLFSYVGNPYTLNFAEANDPEKGFQVLYDDGLLEFVPTNLRKHVVIETDLEGLDIWEHTGSKLNLNDIVWIKVKGPRSELSKLDKKHIGEKCVGRNNFKLDLIPTESADIIKSPVKQETPLQILDNLIDLLGDTVEHKALLKSLSRELIS